MWRHSNFCEGDGESMQHWYRHWHFEEPGHAPSLACDKCFHARVGLLVAAEDSCSNLHCVCTECGAPAGLGTRAMQDIGGLSLKKRSIAQDAARLSGMRPALAACGYRVQRSGDSGALIVRDGYSSLVARMATPQGG